MMFRRSIARPQHQPLQHANTCCSAIVTSCAGIFTPSSQLLASNVIQPHKIIGFKQGRKNAACVELLTKWTWDPLCKQFTDLVHSPSLALPKGRKMEPEMQVFAELNIDENILRNQPRDPKSGAYIPVYAHCDIEGVMKANGFMPELDDARYIAASSAERKLMRAELVKQMREVDKIIEDNRRMVDQLSICFQEQKGFVPSGKAGTMIFLQLCEFNDRRQFRILSGGHDFRIFGKTCHSKPDCYMVECLANNNLLLILQDTDKEADDEEAVPSFTNLGQFVGEMLMMLSASHKEKQFRNVLGVRYSNGRVCGFRLDSPTKRQLDTLIETRNVPHKNLQFLCTHQDPANCTGWSLIDKRERRQALQMMADIRAFMLKK